MATFSFVEWSCVISILCGSAFAQLSENFYNTSCPKAASIIRHEVKYALEKDPSLGASLLHLHFKDCGVGGCDASNLLDDLPNSPGEKSSLVNLFTARGYEVIDKIKARLEKTCPRVVSCADILAIVAQDAVWRLGGPSWGVPLGRRDSTEAHRQIADSLIPLFQSTNISTIVSVFEAKGFTKNEFVALQGSHTIGRAPCAAFRKHIYNDTNIDPHYAAVVRTHCPKVGGDLNTSPIDYETPFKFDNQYFINLKKRRGLLAADQALYTGKGGFADAIVADYSSSKANFFKNYVSAIVKFGYSDTLTGTKGEIRTNCRRKN